MVAPEKQDYHVVSAQVRRALGLVSENGVFELRAFCGRNKIVSGYYDDLDRAARDAARLDGRGYAVCMSLNPVEPALLARSNNRIREYPKATTSDRDVTKRLWLPVDCDPVRPADVSATSSEKRAALFRIREIRDYLREEGFSEPLVGDSGNGGHLLYRIDLPNDVNSLDLVREVLESLAFRFGDDEVKVDTTTCNAARVWKVYGTVARKGDHVPERPHRRSKLLKVPGENV